MNDYLRLLDKFIRHYENIEDFTGEEEEYRLLLKLIANKRYRKNEENVDDCFERLLKDSKAFVSIYRTRGSK